jgi:hypothetical protein
MSGSPVPDVAAVAMKIAIGPAVTFADRGSPERFAPNSPDDDADHRTGRPGDEKAGSSARHRSNRIGLRGRNPERPRKNCRRHQQLTHQVTPLFGTSSH